MDHQLLRKNTRTTYFGNVKSRLGPKLPSGVSQPPQFTMSTWEVQPLAPALQQPTLRREREQQPISNRPLSHTPYIRNPKLRQYYLQGTQWEVGCSDVNSYKASSGETVFSVSSQFCGSPQPSTSQTLISQKLPIDPRVKVISGLQDATRQRAPTGSKLESEAELEPTAGPEPVDLAAQPQSPSPEAEYDKLLDVEAVPLPDGQLCLLALPPECCESEGADGTPYLKLFCRYITDCKGVVSGILLVTSNKLFFDPCKTHPLVREHGCEEYVLACSVDSLASVSFFSDISQVHFSSSQQSVSFVYRSISRLRYKHYIQRGVSLFAEFGDFLQREADGTIQTVSYSRPAGGDIHVLTDQGGSASRQLFFVTKSSPKGAGPAFLQKLNPSKSKTRHHPSHKEDGASLRGALRGDGEEEEPESGGVAEAEKELDSGLIQPKEATGLNSFCCGETDATSRSKGEETTASVTEQRAERGSPGRLMFVRLRARLPAGRKRGAGSVRTLPRRDTWLALSQESSDELYAYLTHCRPDLCLLEGDQEGEDEFVLVDEQEEAEEEEGEDSHRRQRSSTEDWEMVLMEDNREKPSLDREPEGLQSIVERSQILEASHVQELCKELPPRTVGHNWKLTYSTSSHGSSLKSLYRRVSASDSPALIVIKDALDEVFGAFLSHPLRPSENFYGTGETFLYMLHPRFKCFRWTGENSFFIKGDLDSFAIGGGSGHFGLWVDENLYLGRSSPCFTFNNCCLSETDDFRIIELEVWTFG